MSPPGRQRLCHGLARHPVQQMRVRRHGDLGVAHLLGDEVTRQPDDQGQHVVRTSHQTVHRDVHLDEVREVGEVVEGDQLVPLGRLPAGTVAARQLQDGVDRGSALQMHVQFHLRQTSEKRVRRVVRHARDAIAAQWWPVLSGWPVGPRSEAAPGD
jgi:hypothetical protein